MKLRIIILFAALINIVSSHETVIRMTPGAMHGIPPKEAKDPRSIARRAIFEQFRKENPDIRIVHSGGIELSMMYEDAGFLMSMAGETAPDIFYVNFRQYYNYIDQGFCRPLDDLIAKDPIVLEDIHPNILNVLKSYDKHVYAMPWYQVAQGLYYRKDHFEQAGLNPNKPPRTWEEFFEYGKKIVESNPSRKAFTFYSIPGFKAYHWANFVWQAGGEIVAPNKQGVWKSHINSPEAAKALDFFKRLTTETWISPKTGKRLGPIAQASADPMRDVADGKVSMWFSYTNDVILATLTVDINPAFLGVARMPSGPAGNANEVNAGMWAINSAIKDPKKIEACWKFIKYFMGDKASKINTDKFVELGFTNLVHPNFLNKFGYNDLVSGVDPEFVKASVDLFKTGHPEPYGRNCQHVYIVLDNALDQAMLDPKKPSSEILAEISKEIDNKLLGYTPAEQLKAQRTWAWSILTLLIITVIGVIIYFAKKQKRISLLENPQDQRESRIKAHRVYRLIAFCIAPAGLSLLIWAYYPIVKGLLIAFQDYKLISESKWIGLDNFIKVFTQPLFYKSLMNSFIFVGLSLALGFFIPIFLAIAINEIPKGKSIFRLIYYIPAMTSPIVITLLWRQFYDSTDTGLLNTIVGPGIDIINWCATHLFSYNDLYINKAINWLGEPNLAMLSVVLPGIWAAAGPGSILYMAALKNIPDERYDAADLDGANWKQKIRFIMLPGLKPLIIVNLLGVFIAGFKSMENIFLLTGGGPLHSTHTVGLEIWTNAFLYLRFGYATAAAWIMGSILIGFTLIQINNLLNMRFSASKL